MLTQISPLKKLLLVSLAAAGLSLSACADSAPEIDEPEAMETVDDAQTPIEQEAISVDDVEQVTEDIDSANIDDALVVDPAVADNDATIVTTDEIADAEMLDGTETEESVSTY